MVSLVKCKVNTGTKVHPKLEEFMIRSEPFHVQNAYAKENTNTQIESPRFSVLEYSKLDDCEVYIGQVCAIIEIDSQILMLMSRMCEKPSVGRKLPYMVMGYELNNQAEFIIDPINVFNIKNACFSVPCLDQSTMRLDSIGSHHLKLRDQFLIYVLHPNTVLCVNTRNYDDYVKSNMRKSLYSKLSSSDKVFNYNNYLSVEEMLSIRDVIN